MQSNQALIAGLREYIRNNKAIDATYQRISGSMEHIIRLESLKLAFHTGDANSAVFRHPTCSLLVLALIEDGTFPFWEGITLYFYCMALMQYTEDQPLREEDEEAYQLDRGRPQVGFLVQNGKVTDEGLRYLESIEAKCRNIPGYRFNRDELIAHMSTQLPVANWLIQLPRDSAVPVSYSFDNLMSVLVKDVGYFGESSQGTDSFTVPSLVLMNFMHAAQDKNPLQFKPAFGSISKATLVKCHAADVHPLALYSPWVKSNPVEVHSFEGGPVGSFIHDVAHVFWANLLSYEERKLIITDVIPAITAWTAHPDHDPDKIKMEAIIKRIAFRTQDYNFSLLSDFLHPSHERDEQLATYLMTCMTGIHALESEGMYAHEDDSTKDLPTWGVRSDHLFLACTRTVLQKRMAQAPSMAWWDRIHEINLRAFTNGKRNPAVLTEIIKEAHRLEGCEQPQPSQLGLFAAVQARSASVGRGESMNPRAQVS